MELSKFGGASVKDAKGIKNVASIVRSMDPGKKILVISAMGKATNALEDVINNYFNDDEIYLQYLREIREYHISVAYELLKDAKQVEFQLFALFDTIEHFCSTHTEKDYNYIYDQIVSVGELASTKLVHAYFKQEGMSVAWLDARELVLTNSAFTDAKVDWELTQKAIKEKVAATEEELMITQGFIGGCDKGTTTLGREGSDFTASIFSYCTDATSMSIWKDVPGVLNADPREFDDTELLTDISYLEAIEMTYYGAKVIHPKTIRPLQNKKIPLYVKSFVEPKGIGTTIHEYKEDLAYPPIIVLKRNQILLSFRSRDFSFIAEDSLSVIFKAFDTCRLRINMMHTGAISFSVSVDNNKPEKIKKVKALLKEEFRIIKNEDLELLTIRHYNDAIMDRELKGKEILLEQKTRTTIQCLYRVEE